MTRARVSAVAATVALVQACGGSSPSAPTPTPTPQPTPAPPIVAAQISRTLSAGYHFPNTINTTRNGTLTVQLNWTSAANKMVLGVATSACTVDAYHSFTCSFLAMDGGLAATPTKTLTVPNLAPAPTWSS